eukprot:UN34760
MPESTESDYAHNQVVKIFRSKQLTLGGEKLMKFDPKQQIYWHYDKVLPMHSNGMTLTCYGESGEEMLKENFYSIGGGFVIAEGQQENAFQKYIENEDDEHSLPEEQPDNIPFPFSSADDLVRLATAHDCKISEIVWQNERTWYT